MSYAGQYGLGSSSNPPIEFLQGNIGGPVGPNGAFTIDILTANTTVLVNGNPGTNTLTLNFGSSTNLGLGASFASLTTGIGDTGCGIEALRDVSSGSRNAAFGSYALRQLDTGNGNCAFGHISLTQLTSGSLNVALGRSSGELLQSGSYNILIGYNSGRALTTGGSNIIIGSNLQPALNSESNTIRIGKAGTGDELQNRCFIAAIRATTPALADAQQVVIDSAGQLGSIAQTNGQVLIGSTGANPVAATLTAGANISITNAPGSITISASGSSVVTYANVNITPFVAATTDYFLSVDCSASAITVQLPDAPAVGETWIVKDRLGNAAVNNITVTTPSGVILFDGAASFVMNTAYQAAQFIFNGANYEVY